MRHSSSRQQANIQSGVGFGPPKKIDPLDNINDYSTGHSVEHIEIMMFDPDHLAPNYVGIASVSERGQNSVKWKIYKYTYVANGGITSIQIAYGAWSARGTLFGF